MDAALSDYNNRVSSAWLTMPPLLPAQCITSATLGLLSHIFIFIEGEYHLLAPLLFRLYISLAALLLLIQTVVHAYNVRPAAIASACVVGSYATALFGSMAIYRVFLHRLRRFPGPPLAKLSKLWHVVMVMDAKQYLFLDGLRERYGDYVRTG